MDSSSESMSHAAVPGFDAWLYSWVQHPARADYGRQQWQLNWMGPLTRQTGTEFLSPCLGPGPTLTSCAFGEYPADGRCLYLVGSLLFNSIGKEEEEEKSPNHKTSSILKQHITVFPKPYWQLLDIYNSFLFYQCWGCNTGVGGQRMGPALHRGRLD